MGAVQVMHKRILLIPTAKKTWKLTPRIMRAMRGDPTVTIVYQKTFLAKTFLTHATQGGMSRGDQIIYDQILTKYDKDDHIHGKFPGR